MSVPEDAVPEDAVPEDARPRRHSRELALALLYEADSKQATLSEVLAGQLLEPPEFARELLGGIEENLDDIDARIQRHTQGWDIDRLARVDLALLRLGVFEVCFFADTPHAVAMDEVVELAKQYSTTESSRYINGVLAGVLAESDPTMAAGAMAEGRTMAEGRAMTAGAMTASQQMTDGQLVLRDGTSFSGKLFGATSPTGFATGEVVFNTSMVGYQEIITDPSYAGQIIAFTYPHIGNYGITAHDDESQTPACRGIIVRNLTLRPSNWRAQGSLSEQLAAAGLSAIADIDTRRLTRHIRQFGSMVGAFGALTQTELLEAAQAEPGTDGVDLISQVTCAEPYMADEVLATDGVAPSGPSSQPRTEPSPQPRTEPTPQPRPWRVVAYDFGIKRTILRQLASFAEVEVVPASTPHDEVLARQPHGVFLSNGPGDPRCSPEVSQNIAQLLGKLPVFGICLGHQILAQALGAEIVKLPFGHHGGNHPVANCATGQVEITAQNHNFAVAHPGAGSGAGAAFEVTHLNLNDKTVEGLWAKEALARGIQYHPEAGPGPHDSRYLFGEFRQMMESFHKP